MFFYYGMGRRVPIRKAKEMLIVKFGLLHDVPHYFRLSIAWRLASLRACDAAARVPGGGVRASAVRGRNYHGALI